MVVACVCFEIIFIFHKDKAIIYMGVYVCVCIALSCMRKNLVGRTGSFGESR